MTASPMRCSSGWAVIDICPQLGYPGRLAHRQVPTRPREPLRWFPFRVMAEPQFPHTTNPVRSEERAKVGPSLSFRAAKRRSCSALVKMAGHAPLPMTSPRWRRNPAW